ncbi:MAG TPA: hypothetical protein VMR21_17240 [Vicinamibacteria bacterium]|nr:hypothetical protein [Vicinamibacteria bacterium]
MRPAAGMGLTLLLFVGTAVFVAFSLALSPVARRAPLTVGMVTLCLLGAQLLADLVPAVAERLRPLERADVFGVERTRESVMGPRVPAKDRARGEKAVLAWVALLLAGILLLGLLPGLALHSAAWLRHFAGLRLAVAVAVVAAAAAGLHAVFASLLGYALYDGLLWTAGRALL